MRVQEPTLFREISASTDSGSTVGHALAHGLNLPLAALRASVEALSTELSTRDVGQTFIRGALEEVERLDKNLQDLLDFANAPRPRPLECSLDEIFYSARGPLSAGLRSRLVFARPSRARDIEVDGPLLARILRRLIENALESSQETVLVLGRQEDHSTSYTVIDSSTATLDFEWASIPFHTTKPNHLGLGLPLIRRDLDRMGGRLEVRPSGRMRTALRIIFPNRAASQEEAA